MTAESLEKNSTELARFRRLLETVEPESGALPDSVRKAFEQALSQSWDSDKCVFVFGQLDIDKMIFICKTGVCPWWPVLSGRVTFGDLDGMRKVHAAFQGQDKDKQPNLSSAMTWGCYPCTIADGYSNHMKQEVLEQLFAWGADPCYEQNKWFERAMEKAEGSIIRVFINHGAPVGLAARALHKAMASGNAALAERLGEALIGNGGFTKVDDQTLIQTQYLPDAQGAGIFRTMFNFRSHRVHEIYENGGRAAMAGVSFDEYDSKTLDAAREKLKELGGTPDENSLRIRKSSLPRPQGEQNGAP